MPSLCTYDKGTRGYEGRRYSSDIAAALDAQISFFGPIRAAKKKLPRFIMLEGNHEHRIERAIDQDAAHLEHIISQEDLCYEKFGWEYVRYNGSTPGVIIVDGIAYAHYFTSGVMGRPISGEHAAYSLIVKKGMSCTQGHVHTTDYALRTAADGSRRHGLVAGCYQDYDADWAGNANELWWRGVVVRSNVKNGTYDPQWIGLDAIRREYG